jgi:hypothetical protein
MEVDHGSFDVGMAEVFLYNPEIDPGFQEMGSIGMTQGMYRGTLCDAGV